MAGPGIEPGTSGSRVRRATDCANEHGILCFETLMMVFSSWAPNFLKISSYFYFLITFLEPEEKKKQLKMYTPLNPGA